MCPLGDMQKANQDFNGIYPIKKDKIFMIKNFPISNIIIGIHY